MASSSTPISVIIIGAGISGISAAKRLDEAGVSDFLILEATSRIGGRIHRTEFGGKMVELGANWLHGGEGPLCTPIFHAANKIKLNIVYSDYTNVSSRVYRQEGGLYEKEEVETAMKEAEKIVELGTKLSASMQGTDDMSILALQRLYKRVPTSPLERFLDFYYYDFEDGEPPRVTSLKHTLPRLEFDDFGEDQYFVADPRGFENIVHHFAKQFLTYGDDEVVNDARIQLSKVVKEICYTNNGVTVKTEDGSTYQAKAAIVSVSLGVLQNDLIEFTPRLPEWKEHSICGFSITSYTKIFLKFPYKFWPTGPGTDYFFYVHERRGYYPVWKHYENEMPGSNILLVITCDEESMRIEKQSDEKTKSETMDVLSKIFGGSIPEAEDILVSRWMSNKYYLGTFSNWPIGYTKQCHEQLRAPVGSVYFTGEHTNPDHFGCVEGAYFAGQGTAMDVIKYLQKGPCKE